MPECVRHPELRVGIFVFDGPEKRMRIIFGVIQGQHERGSDIRIRRIDMRPAACGKPVGENHGLAVSRHEIFRAELIVPSSVIISSK